MHNWCLVFYYRYTVFVFVQGQHDFQTGRVPLRKARSDSEQHEIENECLGMAVLAITHHAMYRRMPLRTVTHEVR